MAQGEKERSRAQNRSKYVAWHEPLRLLQRMNKRKDLGKEESRSFGQKDGKELNSRKPSKWTNFWTKAGFHRGNNVHAERKLQGCFFRAGPEMANYDSQNYALNFEEERHSPASTSPELPIISGPGARAIVTVLLTRNATILIPKHIILDVKQETNLPLWMRRGVSTPAPLHIRTR